MTPLVSHPTLLLRILIAALICTPASPRSQCSGTTQVDFAGLGVTEGQAVLSVPGAPELMIFDAILIRPGVPARAFYGNSSGTGVGGVDDANSGDCIAYPNGSGSPLTIAFQRPVSEVCFEALDIEIGTAVETLTVRVYDAAVGGTLLHTRTLTGGDPNTGDGARTVIDLTTGFAGAHSIGRLEINGVAQAPGATICGYAIDNLSYTPAQITQTASNCPAPSGPGVPFTNLAIAGGSVAPTALLLQQTSTFTSPVALHLKIIGFGNPTATLPSCGCSWQTTIDWIDVQVPTCPVVPCGPSYGTSLAIAIPASASGTVFHAQALTIDMLTAVSGQCTEIGASFSTSESYRVSIQ